MGSSHSSSASRSSVVVEGVVVEMDEQQRPRRVSSRLRRGLSGGSWARPPEGWPPEQQQQRRDGRRDSSLTSMLQRGLSGATTLRSAGYWARDAEERELFELFNTAIGYGLSNEDAVRRMIENYRAGNYSFDHYANLWRGRNADAARGVNAAADRLETAPVRPGMAREATGLHQLATGVHLAREATGLHPWPAPPGAAADAIATRTAPPPPATSNSAPVATSPAAQGSGQWSMDYSGLYESLRLDGGDQGEGPGTHMDLPPLVPKAQVSGELLDVVVAMSAGQRNAECCICFEYLHEQPQGQLCCGPAQRAACSHFFHHACALNLLNSNTRNSRQCPVCRASYDRVKPVPQLTADPDGWFAAVDTGGEGYLSRREVLNVLVAQYPVDMEKLEKSFDALWKRWDVTGSGYLTKAEFVHPERGLLNFVRANLLHEPVVAPPSPEPSPSDATHAATGAPSVARQPSPATPSPRPAGMRSKEASNAPPHALDHHACLRATCL